MTDVREVLKQNGTPPPLPSMDLPQLVIKILPDGSVAVTGPVHHRMLCYGRLETARDAIRDFKPSPIIPL